MSQFFISSDNFRKFVDGLIKDSRLIAPLEAYDKLYLTEITPENAGNIKLSGFRTVESLKSYIYKITEKVSAYFGKDTEPQSEKIVILGVRGCDLEALEILDKVFIEGDFKDPFYSKGREKIIIIGTDCTDCGETCFCSLVEGKPYPTKLYDLNLSPVSNGFIVEVGSEKGQWLINKFRNLFIGTTHGILDEKENNRKKTENALDDKNKDYKLKIKLSEIHKRNLENHIWSSLTKDCVECSACNFICPTCTCFLLLDQEKNLPAGRHGKSSERYKVWDGCLKAGYAGVAGGANPRGKLYQRLQNRYNCKFDYSFDRLNRLTCVGCGRCIDGCAGKIDMRKIFVELEKQVPLTAKLK